MEHKIFAAERKLKALRSEGTPAPVTGDLNEVIRLLMEIKSEVGDIKRGNPLAVAVSPPLAQDLSATPLIPLAMGMAAEPAPIKEINFMKTEMRALAVCIEQTKVEIASLRPSGTEEDRLLVVANELDAIVVSTEQATNIILESAEKLDSLGHQLQSYKESDPFVKAVADEIGDTIINIYEACNFQDITGQRISKVVKTLEFIEQRIMAMISIWGDDAIAEIQPQAQSTHKDEEDKLLNGPQLADKGISQDEIDKLFG